MPGIHNEQNGAVSAVIKILDRKQKNAEQPDLPIQNQFPGSIYSSGYFGSRFSARLSAVATTS